MESISPPSAKPTYMTAERRLIQEAARNFAMHEVMPIANELDPIQGDIPPSLNS